MFVGDFIYKQNLINLTILVMVLVVFTSQFVVRLNKKLVFLINFLLLVLNIGYILYNTIFSRETGCFEVLLMPFNFLTEAKNQPEMYRSFFMNCLLFVPLGLTMPYVISKKPLKRNLVITIIFALALSAGIEFVQYYYHLGRCEADDVIANTLGAAVGTLSYLLYIRILKNREESLMNSKITDNQKLLLDLCSNSLSGKDFALQEKFDCNQLVDEAKRQTVLPQVFSFIKDKCNDDTDKLFSQIVAKNIRVEYAHNEVHRVLSANNIPYVVLKGVASAAYYKEPMLRMMGDVDVLVAPENIDNADKLLKSIGFVTTDDINGDDMHIGYKRKDGISCELHRKIGWAPKTEVGDIVNKYLSDIFEKSVEHRTSNGSCVVPDKFHHGLILLLHTATHLTHEGIGLRHLCDWAVFVNNFSNEEFVDTFEKPLKDMGLWRFAQLLTLCCIKYLGCDKREWVGKADDNLLDGIIADILNGGNFGTKDLERYSQIKYISDRKEGSVSKKSAVKQLFSTINTKTKKDFKFVNKFKILLPIGWLFTICKYFYMVIIGKRTLDGISTIKAAESRKSIYNEFKLFENNQK